MAIASPAAHSRVRRTVQRGVLFDGLDGDVDCLGFFVDGHRDIPGDEVTLVLGLEGEVIGQMPRSAELEQHLTDPLGQSGELNLFALDDDQAPTLAGLEEKESIADFAAHADHDLVGAGKDIVHDGPSSFNDPVLLTQSTTGVRR